MTCIGALATKTVAEMVATIRAVGVEHVTLGTDFGQSDQPASGAPACRPTPTRCSPRASPKPRSARMACTNPCSLLGNRGDASAAHRHSRRQGRSRGARVGAAARDGHGARARSATRSTSRASCRCASASSRACASRRSTAARSASSGARPPGAAEVMTEDDYAHVARVARRIDGYTERERLAIEYAERFALDSPTRSTTTSSRACGARTRDAEVLDLTVCIGGWLALGRTLHVLGIDDSCRIPDRHRCR